MPQPTASDGHIDAPLTNISVAFIQNQMNFVSLQAFPVVPVTKQSDKYFVFDQNAWFTDQMELRAESTESAGSGYALSSDSYSCDVYALHKDVSDRSRANSDNPLNPDRNATQWLTQKALLKQEIKWVADYFTTSVWTTDLTPTTLWDVYATSDPVSDIETGKRTILINTGFEANTLVLGYDVFIKLKHHPDIRDRFKYTSPESITAQMMGAVFDVPRVLVSKSVKATNNEGATAAYDFTHGKHALLCHSATAPGLEVPSAGYTFMWSGVSAGLGANVAVSRFRMEHLKSDRIEIEAGWDNKVVSADLGYFFNGAVS